MSLKTDNPWEMLAEAWGLIDATTYDGAHLRQRIDAALTRRAAEAKGEVQWKPSDDGIERADVGDWNVRVRQNVTAGNACWDATRWGYTDTLDKAKETALKVARGER